MFSKTNEFMSLGLNGVLQLANKSMNATGLPVPKGIQSSVDATTELNTRFQYLGTSENFDRLLETITSVMEIVESIETFNGMASHYAPMTPWGEINDYDAILQQIEEGLVMSSSIYATFGEDMVQQFMREAREYQKAGLPSTPAQRLFADKLYRHSDMYHRVPPQLREKYTYKYILTEATNRSNALLINAAHRAVRDLTESCRDVEVISFVPSVKYLIAQHHYEKAGELVARVATILNATK